MGTLLPAKRGMWVRGKCMRGMWSTCLFTTKSSYSWLILKKMGIGPYRLFWKRIWKHKILPKIQVFAWRVGNEILPTNTKIATIRPTVNSTCQQCGADKETLTHAIKDCPTARETLVCGGLDNKLVRNEFDSCIDWLEATMRLLDKKSYGGLHYSYLQLVEQQKQFYLSWQRGVLRFKIINRS
ncbi:hypothetical protein Golob_026646 [Gossypium lobatum]|uniref:Reverse transcriptase zinc-binding domain-containing protein n=1 Tax=Gossypium lobatum TaxID=34289 RepID=A0A7J8LVS2_9ROSI|nr:hypothetical protein [Gossypium lobatum]